MSARHGGREAAIQILFQLEATGQDPALATELYYRHFETDIEGRPYALELVRGTWEQRESLDKVIQEASDHWRLDRMTRVDRSILRLAAWELTARSDIPRAVILDEGVELAKRFGSEESFAFVNGVLNKIADKLGRAR